MGEQMGQNSKNRRQNKLSKSKSKIKSTNAVAARLDQARKRYVNEWNITSTFFQEEGHYVWMGSKVDGFDRILEVGCGSGYSTLSLLKAGHRVVTIEENPRFIDRTRDLLQQNGFSVEVSKRGLILPAKDADHYAIAYSDVDTPGAQAVLVEGDVLEDQKLMSWLNSNGPFDAVVCWLMGTHKFRGGNTCAPLFGVHNSTENRLLTQTKLMNWRTQYYGTAGY
jgi:hypothetical protein